MLPVYVFDGVEEHTVGGVVVRSGPARLLQVVFQRPGYVRVDHQTNVGLVDAHAECVGGGDRPEPAFYEIVLDLLLPLGRQPGVEVVALISLLFRNSATFSAFFRVAQ